MTPEGKYVRTVIEMGQGHLAAKDAASHNPKLQICELKTSGIKQLLQENNMCEIYETFQVRFTLYRRIFNWFTLFLKMIRAAF